MSSQITPRPMSFLFPTRYALLAVAIMMPGSSSLAIVRDGDRPQGLLSADDDGEAIVHRRVEANTQHAAAISPFV